MLAKPDFYRVIRRGCVSLYPLYGGEKNQRRNYVRVSPGSAGLATYEVTEGGDGSVYYWVKFKIGTRFVHVRCAPHMIRLDPIGVDNAGGQADR